MAEKPRISTQLRTISTDVGLYITEANKQYKYKGRLSDDLKDAMRARLIELETITPTNELEERCKESAVELLQSLLIYDTAEANEIYIENSLKKLSRT